jgi:glyoxylase-like metal-dependent hydrolase (beta-lactamase superfamily II)
MRKTFIILSALVAASAVAQQQDFSKVQMKVIKVAGTVYMLQGAGGNIGVSVGDDGIVIVDDQFAPLAPKIKEALKAITDKPIKFIINTHYHGDHTGGNEVFGREGTIIAHDNVRKRLESGSKALGRQTPPAPKIALPVVTFNDRATLHVNGEDIRITHLPHGHTDGDAIVEFTKSNVVHMGDDFFNGTFPFIDRENGGSIKGLIANLDAVLAKMDKNAKVIPGHGPLGDWPSLDTWRDALKGTVAIMNEAIQKGKTLEEVKKEKTLVAWEHLANDFITLDMYEEGLYNELKVK